MEKGVTAWNGFLAALILFTRLPLWRVAKLDKRYLSDAIRYWPLTGYLTGGLLALVFVGMGSVLPVAVAASVALVCRVLFTGALHEDGLADCADGFGGGHTREQILVIMKDSRVGGYGVIALGLYFLLFWNVLTALGTWHVVGIIVAADCFSKFCTATLVDTLTYVRPVEERKFQLTYSRLTTLPYIGVGLLCVLPLIYVGVFVDPWVPFAALGAIGAACGIRYYLKSRLGGYTGDCCGGSFLVIEQVFYLGALILFYW